MYLRDSNTRTRTEVRSPTRTNTDAYTQGNITITGGAGAGDTSVTIKGKDSKGKLMNSVKMDLNESQKERLKNLDLISGSIGILGSILGIIYAKKSGGGAGRYIGYFILGGLITGIPANILMNGSRNKILKEGSPDPGKK